MFDPLPQHMITQIAAWAPLEGWAPQEKMRDMAALILRERPALVVEVGVFAGRSALPQALALRKNAFGLLVGVDPYSNAAAKEGTHGPEHTWWWTEDLTKFRDQFLKVADFCNLTMWIKLIEKRSQDAVHDFADGSIDIAHVDGNHSKEVATGDMAAYWPKLKPGGWLWVDDTNWESLGPALGFLKERGELIKDYGAWQLWRKPA